MPPYQKQPYLYLVSLLVRLWVEILYKKRWFTGCMVSLLVRLWVEMRGAYTNVLTDSVSLLVRLWVEMQKAGLNPVLSAVSLLVRLWVEISNVWGKNSLRGRQPPCEAVSWNLLCCVIFNDRNTVSLLVRLWVEMWSGRSNLPLILSASLWGCELKYPDLPENCYAEKSASLWGCELKLKRSGLYWIFHQSASLWGCELKYFWHMAVKLRRCCQPPCEAVSWNIFVIAFCNQVQSQPPCEAVSWNISCMEKIHEENVSLLVRLWVEIFILFIKLFKTTGQPPCEAVSWNHFQL